MVNCNGEYKEKKIQQVLLSKDFLFKRRIYPFYWINLLLLLLLIIPGQAVVPDWTSANVGKEISDIVISPDGSSVVAGAGKVTLIARDGTILAKEPFGEIVSQTTDGSVIVSAYASTVYAFNKKEDTEGSIILQKMWEATPSPEPIVSCLISDKGERVVINTRGGGLRILDGKTGKMYGSSEVESSLVAMSAKGTIITGISLGDGLKKYSSTGKTVKMYDLSLTETPKSYIMTADGRTGVLNDGRYIESININNGTILWKTRGSGPVTTLVMNSAGKSIIAGTETGILDGFNTSGALIFSYDSRNGSASRQSIEDIAMTPDSSKIIAGSYDGKIILFDSDGNEVWIYNINKPVRNVAISADGSLVVAASESTLYGFYTKSASAPRPSLDTEQTISVTTATQTITPENQEIIDPIESLTEVPDQFYDTPAAAPTEYAVIRTAEKTPACFFTILFAFLVVSILLKKN